MKKHKRGTIWIRLGIGLIICAMLLTAYNLLQDYRGKKLSGKALESLETEIDQKDIPLYQLYPDMEMPVKIIDGIGYIGILEIPDFDLRLPVIHQWSYPNLKIAPCRYQGTAYKKDFIIAGHNFYSHFSRLKNLEPGSKVKFTDMAGNVFLYQVTDLETIPGTEVEEMEAGEWDLTLFTCSYGGQNRAAIRCAMIQTNEVRSP